MEKSAVLEGDHGGGFHALPFQLCGNPARMALPVALKWVLHYANAAPTKSTWRRIVLGPRYMARTGRTRLPILGIRSREELAFGIRSREELESILEEYRVFLGRWVRLGSASSAEAEQLVHEINDRAALQFERWALAPESGRLSERWSTITESFREMLYSCLAATLNEVSFRAIHQCEACARFFYEPAKRGARFCSVTCTGSAEDHGAK